MQSALSAPCFHDEAAAFAELEANLWPPRPSLPALRRLGPDHDG